MRPSLRLIALVTVLVLLSIAPAASAHSPHPVQGGETLAKIAAQHGVSTAAIIRANGITNPDLIRVGQRLVIPGASAGSNPGNSTSTPKPTAKSYVVRGGDTLGSIAARYGVSINSLVAANGLANPNRIYPGMTLRIPGGSGGGATTGGGGTTGVGGTRFVVDISSQHCWLYSGNALVGDWACSTGRRGAPTMAGSFRVQSKIRNAYGSAWDFWMPYWLGIYWAGKTENGIHGLPYNKATGRQTWAGMVGTPITFGCVMLNDAHAKQLWETAYIGMPVVIRY